MKGNWFPDLPPKNHKLKNHNKKPAQDFPSGYVLFFIAQGFFLSLSVQEN
jgi:hypothetical protein